MYFYHHVSRWFDCHPQMAAALTDEPLESPEVHSWFFGCQTVGARFGLLIARSHRSLRWHDASDFRDRDQRMRTLTDVGVLCDELQIHDNAGKFNSQPSAERHPFTS